MNSGRLAGSILMIIGLAIALIAALWIGSQVSSDTGLSSGGAVVGAGLAFIPVALLVGFGFYLSVQGGREAQIHAAMARQRRVLDIVQSRGKVTVFDLALEMNISVDELKSIVHRLVGLQVFSGYINWDDGVLYSEEAGQLRDLKHCKNCGSEIELVGKGVVTCPYCGTEYFLAS